MIVLRKLAVIFVMLSPMTANATPIELGSYQIIDLGQYSTPRGISNRGEVVGYFSDPLFPAGGVLSGYRWNRIDGAELLDIPDGFNASVPDAINDLGEIAGTVRVTDVGGITSSFFASYWDKNGNVTVIPSGQGGNANDINNQGYVVGEYTPAEGSSVKHGFRWSQVNGFEDLPALPVNGSNGLAKGINESGVVVGYSTNELHNLTPVTWDEDGVIQIFDNTVSDGTIFGIDINEQGNITGHGFDSVYFGSDATGLISLGFGGIGAAINNRNQIVGRAGGIGAYLFSDFELFNLNDFLPRDSGWFLNIAWDVNNRGDIVGTGFKNGIRHGFLLINRASVPEPVTIDIKPGSDPNSVNLNARGFLPVAILTEADFDALRVDYTTVEFGPAAATPAREAKAKDVDDDGDSDLILHFKISDTGIACGDTAATLTGTTFGGEAISGTDSVKIVKCP